MRATLLVALLLAVALPASASASDLSDLRAAQERWAVTGYENYAFTVAIGCFCPTHVTKPRRVTVRDGQAVDPPKVVRRYSTVPKLFGVVQQAITDGVDRLDVTYGATGLPRHIYIDRSPMIADEELTLTASRLRVVPR
jgi:hypothetical protein